MQKYYEGKYKYDFEVFSVINRDGYELEIFMQDELSAVNKAISILLEEGYVRIVHGPGTWLELDLERGVVSPDGFPHSDCIPPHIWETLDDEIREKLK